MLDTIALGILLFAGLLLIYGLVALVEIPYRIARERNHPHQDAIRCAGWISLFALHLPWPLLWVWSMLYRHGDNRIPVLTHQLDLPGQAENTDMSLPRAEPDPDPGTAFKSRLELLEKRIKRIEYAIDAAVEEVQHERKVSP